VGSSHANAIDAMEIEEVQVAQSVANPAWQSESYPNNMEESNPSSTDPVTAIDAVLQSE
jgi:hypothetical protein